MRYWICAALAVLLLTVLWSLPTDATPRVQLDYVERVLGAPEESELPLLFAMHGLGDTPENYASVFAELGLPVRLILPRAPDPHAVGSSWYPLDDLPRAPRVIRQRADALALLIRHVQGSRATRGLPIVTGFSQGGVLSFALSAYHSRLLSGAFPVAGLLPEGGPALQVAPAPFRVVALHGTSDARIPYTRGVAAIERLRAAGCDATMFEYEGVGHTFSPPMMERYLGLLREQIAHEARARR